MVANITRRKGTSTTVRSSNCPKDDLKTRMPVINCRDCGGTAWIGLAGKDGGISMGDPRTFYNEYFAYHADNALVTLQPCTMDYVLDGHARQRSGLVLQCMHEGTGRRTFRIHGT